VFDFAAQAADRAVDADGFVHVLSRPRRAAAVVQAQLIVRVPIRGANPASQVPRHSRHAIRLVGGIGQSGLNLLRECRGDSFIGIKRQNPVVRGEGSREVLLRDVPRPGANHDPFGHLLRESDRVVRALRIDHDDLIGPAD